MGQRSAFIFKRQILTGLSGSSPRDRTARAASETFPPPEFLIKYIRPFLLKGRYEGHPQEKERVLDAHISLVRDAMHQVTIDERGTAYNSFRMLAGLGVDSAGKTGSAETGRPGEKTHSWFCGFCPFNEPVLAYSIIIEHGGHGSHAAAPVMASILRMVYQNAELMKDLGIKPQFEPEVKPEQTEKAPAEIESAESEDKEPVSIIIE